MKKYSSLFFYLHIALVTMSLVQIDAESMLSWIWGKQEDLPKIGLLEEVPLISIPYELLTEDEKFLKEAAKLVTDIQISSPLEVCQHKVVLKIKTSCSSMTEEQLAKLSVNLLNCQSLTEGRKVFPCTDDMTIKQCTTNMDADTWNAYHLMSNRARAVCYASRSHQFRALTELTVNKLMQSAQSQIQTLSSLKEGQDRLEEQTIAAHKIIESNIEDLTNEKALIRAGHIQIATMTEDIKRKLEKASQDLLHQSAIHDENHEEILADLRNIEMQAQLLWKKIENSTNRIMEQNQKVTAQYEETLMKLEKINETIVFISDLSNNMRNEIDKKLGWITDYIGKTGENLEKVYHIILHMVYLLGAMIVAAFLQAPFLTRSAILGIIPLNLASYLKHGLNASLDFISLSFLILLITTMHFVMSGIHYLMRSKDEGNTEKENHSNQYFANRKEDRMINGNTMPEYSDIQINESFQFKILRTISNLWKFLTQEISKSIKNIKTTYLSMTSWIWQKYDSREELSCSYLPARKYHERSKCILAYPKKLLDDSSDFSDTREAEHLISRLKKKNISPLSKFFKGLKEPKIRDTTLSREVSPQRLTPVTRALCAASTRSGNPCRLLASRGQNYCHKHASGSSNMGDFS